MTLQALGTYSQPLTNFVIYDEIEMFVGVKYALILVLHDAQRLFLNQINSAKADETRVTLRPACPLSMQRFIPNAALRELS